MFHQLADLGWVDFGWIDLDLACSTIDSAKKKHLVKQNQPEIGNGKIKVNPTSVCELMVHPVVYLVYSFVSRATQLFQFKRKQEKKGVGG